MRTNITLSIRVPVKVVSAIASILATSSALSSISTQMSTSSSGAISTNSPAASANSPATAEQLVESTSYRILYTGLGANLCFFVGSAGFVAFSSLELKNRCPDFYGANLTYLLGFVGFLVSGFVELYIDLYLTNSEERSTTVPRSRYYSFDFFFNVLISALFIIGNILDLVSFFLWRTDNFVLENNMLYVTAYFWLATSMLILWTFFFRTSTLIFSGNWGFSFDSMGTLLFFVGSVFDVITRHYAKPQERQERRTYWLDLFASSLWFLNAVCFLLADRVRLSVKKGTSGNNNNKHDSTVDPDEP
jgi:hypothetical protein